MTVYGISKTDIPVAEKNKPSKATIEWRKNWVNSHKNILDMVKNEEQKKVLASYIDETVSGKFSHKALEKLLKEAADKQSNLEKDVAVVEADKPVQINSFEKAWKKETDMVQPIPFYQTNNLDASQGSCTEAQSELTKSVIKVIDKYKDKQIDESGSHYQFTQGRDEAWCADTVNSLYAEANNGKNPFGSRSYGPKNHYKSTVAELRQDAINNGTFVPRIGKDGVSDEDIKKLTPGDVIIWKGVSKRKVVGEGIVKGKASHVGIVYKVEDGKVYIYEGNANKFKKNENGEYLRVKTRAQGVNGAQDIGELQEVNLYDSAMLKAYSAKELEESGYSGFIDMDKWT